MLATETKPYQGWTNYQTWAVKLWLDNEAPTYHLWRDRALEIRDIDETALTFINPYMDEDRRRVNQLAVELEDWHREQMPELNGFAADLMESALMEINWLEISESLIEG